MCSFIFMWTRKRHGEHIFNPVCIEVRKFSIAMSANKKFGCLLTKQIRFNQPRTAQIGSSLSWTTQTRSSYFHMAEIKSSCLGMAYTKSSCPGMAKTKSSPVGMAKIKSSCWQQERDRETNQNPKSKKLQSWSTFGTWFCSRVDMHQHCNVPVGAQVKSFGIKLETSETPWSWHKSVAAAESWDFFVFMDSFMMKFPCFGKKQTIIADDAPTRIPQRSDTWWYALKKKLDTTTRSLCTAAPTLMIDLLLPETCYKFLMWIFLFSHNIVVMLLHEFGKCSTSGIWSSLAAELHQLLQQLLDLDLWSCWLLPSYPPVPWQAAAEIGCLGAEDLDMGYIVTSFEPKVLSTWSGWIS